MQSTAKVSFQELRFENGKKWCYCCIEFLKSFSHVTLFWGQFKNRIAVSLFLVLLITLRRLLACVVDRDLIEDKRKKK